MLGSFQLTIGQDIHFSQFFAAPQNLNPALTGLMDADYRIAANHKNQWRTIPVPYRTYSISADTKLPLHLKKDVFGAGILFNTDKAGDGGFATNQLALSLSFIKKLNADSSAFLSIAVQPSFIAKSFDPNKLSFNNQFNDGSYNPALSSGENYSRTQFSYFDFNSGIQYQQKLRNKGKLSMGFCYAHLLQNKLSYFSDNSTISHFKYVFNALVEIAAADNFNLIPSAMYQQQYNNQELIAGVHGKFILDQSMRHYRAFWIGALLRKNDALIVNALLDYNQLRFGISYDINTSELRNASNGLGGVELSLVYAMRRLSKIEKNKIICPVFL